MNDGGWLTVIVITVLWLAIMVAFYELAEFFLFSDPSLGMLQ